MFLFWKKFDSEWLLNAAIKQFPDKPKLHDSIQEIKRIKGQYFVSPENPNKPGSQWQFDYSITLEDTVYGDVVIDVLKDGRIGSIEYLDDILKRKN